MLEQRLLENLVEFEKKVKSLRKDVYKDLKKYRKQGDEESVIYCRGYIHSLDALTKGLHFYLDKSLSEHKIDEIVELNPSNWTN